MPEQAYLNFDLEIEKVEGGYRAHVLSSPAGEARAPLGPLGDLSPDAAPAVLGVALFDAVFRGDVLACLRRSLDIAKSGDKGLRIRFRLSETPELAGLPWELLYDHQRGSFLALSRETPLVRYLDLPEPAEAIAPEIRLRVLAVIASPSDYPPIDVEQEWANLKQALADLEARGTVTLDRLEPPTVDALQRQLLKHEYHILHFLGHGDYSPEDQDSVLLLTAADGRGEAVSGETFNALFQDQQSLRLALINACRGAVSGEHDPYSGVAQRLVRGGVPAVIAMRSAISVAAGQALAHSFYTGLASGFAVDAALSIARNKLFSGGFPEEWATPALYMRAADGRLWRPDPAARQKRVRIALAAAGAVVALALIAFLIWSQVGPTTMDRNNAMNVAVLDPGLQRADGTYGAFPDAALVRAWMVGELDAEEGPAVGAAVGEANGSVGVWHNGLPRTEMRNRLPVLGNKAAGRRQEAQTLAERILANVVLSSQINHAEGRRVLVPEFYVLARLSPSAGDAIGYYTLGAPIPLADNLAQDSVNREAASREVARRMEILNTVLRALQYDEIGDHAAALDVLQSLAARLGLSDEPGACPPRRAPGAAQHPAAGSGLDTLYYFLAREKLFLDQADAAAQDACRALAIDSENVRARIVLAGALLTQSILADPQESLQPGGLQDQAENEYALAAAKASDAPAEAPDASPQHAIARLGLGDALVARGETVAQLYWESGLPEMNLEADRLLEDAAGQMDGLIVDLLRRNDLWRMVAQYHAIVGSARLQQGRLAVARQDVDAAKAFLDEAMKEFQACREPLVQAPEDETLRDRIIGEGCAPALEAAELERAGLD